MLSDQRSTCGSLTKVLPSLRSPAARERGGARRKQWATREAIGRNTFGAREFWGGSARIAAALPAIHLRFVFNCSVRVLRKSATSFSALKLKIRARTAGPVFPIGQPLVLIFALVSSFARIREKGGKTFRLLKEGQGYLILTFTLVRTRISPEVGCELKRFARCAGGLRKVNRISGYSLLICSRTCR